jgi:hypothetical protein
MCSILAQHCVGDIVIGNYLTFLLMGVVTTQTYTYYTRFAEDKLWVKLFVSAYLLFLLIIKN